MPLVSPLMPVPLPTRLKLPDAAPDTSLPPPTLAATMVSNSDKLPSFYMPLATGALLADTVQPDTVMVPSLIIPPPWLPGAKFAAIVESMMVITQPLALWTPPPPALSA